MINFGPPPEDRRRRMAQAVLAAESGAAPATPEDIASRQRMAQSLIQEGSSGAPVGHWTQALNRGLQGLSGGMMQAQASSDATARAAYDEQQSTAKRMAERLAAMDDKKHMTEWERSLPPTAGGQLDMDYKRAQIEKLQRDAQNGPENPANVREWQFFSKLSPEEQQRYITMKRAEKYLDTGTEFTRPNPVAPGQNITTVPKNIEEAKRRETLGKERGEVAAGLPAIEAASQRALDTVDAIRNHPGKKWGVGVTGIIPGIPGSTQKGFVTLVDQAKGQAFLEAFNSLRGGGQITEAEGRKATEALARLDRAQRPEDFDAALKDYEDVIRKGLDAARQKAGVSPSPTGQQQQRPDPLGLFGGS